MGDLYERWSADDGFLHVRHMGSSLVLLMGGPLSPPKSIMFVVLTVWSCSLVVVAVLLPVLVRSLLGFS